MTADTNSFFAAVLSAGAILSGFCGTFLAFRIQREAAYYRQPAVDFQSGKGKDIPIGLTHFSSAFFLLILATSCSATFGFLFPLLAPRGFAWFASQPGLAVGGMVGSLVLVSAYFLCELFHYGILSGHLVNNAREWKAEWWIVGAGVVIAVGCIVYFARTGIA